MIVLLAIIIAATAGWLFVERHDEATVEVKREAPAKAVSRVGTNASGEPTIALAPAIQRRNGIETAVVQPAAYQEQVRAYGTVLELGALTTLGNNFAAAKAQDEIAQARLAASKAAFNRAQTLYRNQQNVSQADLQTAEAAFRADQAALGAAEAQLQSLAATAVQEWGAVLGKDLAEHGPLVAQLMARQALLVQLSLPPGVSISGSPGSGAIQLANGASLPIRYLSPAPRADAKIQGVSFLYVASAEGGVLPGMDVLAHVPHGGTADAVVVPPSAIVWWQGRAWAYLRDGSETFARHEIPTDFPAPDGSGGYLVRDLPAGAELVTRGAQALLSEEFRAQIDVGD